ncbi:hypothetical protein [Streptomonospora wellingtoniae]|uniref:Alpha/beta hydrolase n=1 Tax=Streptomonospora wellingtoniae TaxID=3075544 RepID=A0ABU2KRA7_9ACTN|nr:hypothetical protein [Streptomonospora sp. DSM 45055]MDT0301821.1 hypothetical protein [Streptomonospora sp. DSM 45055]
MRDALRGRGAHADLAEITDDDGPPYAARYIARAALEIRRLAPPSPVVLAARGAAGPLLPQIGAAQRAAHRPVAAYLIADSLLPQHGSHSRAELRAAQLGDGAADPGAAGAERERPPGFYTEALPMAADWPDAPCGYLLTGGGPAACARLAGLRGWPVLDRSDAGAPGSGADAALAAGLLDLLAML